MMPLVAVLIRPNKRKLTNTYIRINISLLDVRIYNTKIKNKNL